MNSKLLASKDIEEIVLRVGLDTLYDELINRLASEFASNDLLSGVNIPPRNGIHYKAPDLGLIEWMPASINKGTASLKIVGYHPSNPDQRNLPTVISSICLFETDSGHLKVILDGTLLTALRTGAMSAVATRVSIDKDAATLGLVGCGAQAVTQVHALSRILDIERIIAYDKDLDTLNSLEQRITFLDIPIECVSLDSVNRLLESSDALCTCTSEEPGKGPLFSDFANKPGLHINAVGSDFPEKYELPVELLKRGFVYPDFKEQAMIEGECQQLESEEISDDLSSLLKKPELISSIRSRLTVFDSTGHAFADYVTGHFFLDYANRFGLGQEIELECLPMDPKNPYSFFSPSVTRELGLSAKVKLQSDQHGF